MKECKYQWQKLLVFVFYAHEYKNNAAVFFT